MSGQAHSAYYYPTLVLATVIGTATKDPSTKQWLIDALPIDNHQLINQIPWMVPAGIARRPRKGMLIGVLYVNGHPRAGLAIGSHVFKEDPTPAYNDPAPDWAIENIDDLAVYHDETKAFMRFRNVNSTADKPGPDGSAGRWEMTMQSGASIAVEEYQDPPLPNTPAGSVTLPTPSKPQRAKFTLDMPAGTNVTYDEPVIGQATFHADFPSGVTVDIDVTGNVTLTSPDTVLVNATHVQLGGPGGQELAYKSDVQTIVTAFNAHTHSGVASGGATSGPTTVTSGNPIGTTITTAE